jgi:hypothetical protein
MGVISSGPKLPCRRGIENGRRNLRNTEEILSLKAFRFTVKAFRFTVRGLSVLSRRYCFATRFFGSANAM